MMGIDLVSHKRTREPLEVASAVHQKCLARGLIVRPIGYTVVLSPPLTIEKLHVDEIRSVLAESITEVLSDL